MNKKIVFLFILFLTLFGNAQTGQKTGLNGLVSNHIKELQNQKIDTICVYKNYCVSCHLAFDTDGNEICDDNQINPSIYIFYKKDSKTYLTKLNYCWEFSEDIASCDEFWKIYFSNKKKLEKEKFKEFEYYPYKNFKEVKCTLLVDHSGVKNFKLIIKNKIIEKEFNSFQMKEQDDSGILNINYKHNTNLKSKQLVDTLEKITSEAEKNNTFKKIKSR